MKTLIIILLLTPFLGLSQSKKELNAQLGKQIALNDSLELALKEQKHIVDSLKIKTAFQQAQVSRQEETLKDYGRLVGEYTEEISRLEEELDNCLSKGKTTTPQPKPKTPENNPFSGSNGKGSGTGGGFGNDDGIGKGDGEQRYLIAKPNVSEIESEENCTIVFTVMINENGDIVGTPTIIKEKTNTTNTALILKVAQVVKAQAKYNALKKGSKIVKTSLTIQINAK